MKNLQLAQIIRDVKRLVGDRRVSFNTLRSTTVDGVEYVAANAQYNDNAHLGAFFFATDYSNILDVVALLIRTAHNAPHNYSRTLPAYILTVTAYHDAPTRYTLALVTENCWEYPTQGLRIGRPWCDPLELNHQHTSPAHSRAFYCLLHRFNIISVIRH